MLVCMWLFLWLPVLFQNFHGAVSLTTRKQHRLRSGLGYSTHFSSGHILVILCWDLLVQPDTCGLQISKPIEIRSSVPRFPNYPASVVEGVIQSQ